MRTTSETWYRAIAGPRMMLVACAVVVSVTAVSCGGKTGGSAGRDGSGIGGSASGGGSENYGSGGDASSLGGLGLSPIGGSPLIDWELGGGADNSAAGNQVSGGSAGTDGEGGTADDCPYAELWEAVALQVNGGLGFCGPYVCRESVTGIVPDPWGAIVVDGEGKLVDNTRLSGESKEAWLAEFEDERWLCIAGQTLEYCCSIAA